MQYEISTDRSVNWQEFGELMESVGWGSGYSEESFLRSSRAYPFVAHARGTAGRLLGYLTAFSDGAFTTMLGELVVYPTGQGKGIGRARRQLKPSSV